MIFLFAARLSILWCSQFELVLSARVFNIKREASDGGPLFAQFEIRNLLVLCPKMLTFLFIARLAI
jgi:hypothetical protein